MVKEKIRSAWVDILKFIGIWAIYLAHFGTVGGKAYSIVFLFAAQLFFFSAGFFSSSGTENTWEFLKKKTMQLMVPYIFFSVIKLTGLAIQNNWNLAEVYSSSLSLLSGIRNQAHIGAMWFIPCLYFIIIMHFFVMKIFKFRGIALIISIITLIVSLIPNYPILVPSWFWNIDSALYFYLYFVLGAIAFPYINKMPDFRFKKVIMVFLSIIVIIVSIIAYTEGLGWISTKFRLHLPFIFEIRYFIVILQIGVALAIIWFNILLAKLFANVKLLAELGRETLIFCGTEDLFKDIFAQSLQMVNLTVSLFNPQVTIIFALVCLVVSYYTLVRFLNKYFPKVVGKLHAV